MSKVTVRIIMFLLFVYAVSGLVSFPFIDERCLSCGRRACPYGIAKPLRKLSIVEWAFDVHTDGDIHLNGVCPTIYTTFSSEHKLP